MKSSKQTTIQLSKLKKKLIELNKEYDDLGQIQILTSTGTIYLKKIHTIEGKIKGLKWMLSE